MSKFLTDSTFSGKVNVAGSQNNASALNVRTADGSTGSIGFETGSEITGIISSVTDAMDFRVGDGVGMSSAKSLRIDTGGIEVTGNIDLTGGIVCPSVLAITTASSYVQINTASGYIQIGAMNTSHAHIYSDRPSFYFNKNILVNGTTLTGAQTTVSGNAGSATVLQTARTIAGVSFNGSANISLNNNAITNGAGYTTNVGTVTKSGTINANEFPQWKSASDLGALTAAEMRSALNVPNTTTVITNNNQLTNGSGYTTNTGTVTQVNVGTGLDVSNATTTPTVSLDFTELNNIDGDDPQITDFVVVSNEGESARCNLSDTKIALGANKSQFVLNSNFSDDSSTISYIYMPFNTTSDTTSAQYYVHWAAPCTGRIKRIIMQHVYGSMSSGFTTQLQVYKGGSTFTTSGELTATSTNDGGYIEYNPTGSNVEFVKGDRIRIRYSKSATSKYWRGVAASIIMELDQV